MKTSNMKQEYRKLQDMWEGWHKKIEGIFSKEVIQLAVKYRINKEIFYGKSYIDFNKDIEKNVRMKNQV